VPSSNPWPLLFALLLSGCGRDPAPEATRLPAAGTPAAAAAPRAIGPGAAETDVSSVVDRPAPPWELSTWFNTDRPLTLSDLRGRVVLVRWFMSAECPYCSATAPSLVALDADYRDRGLTVVGMYHHKSETPLDPAEVRRLVEEHYRFRFPVAIDDDWKTLKHWWLDAHPKGWTSLSFLLDRRGTIRFIHLGGKYAPDSPDYQQMRRWIEQLLAEP
jgi:peroxiredoxin